MPKKRNADFQNGGLFEMSGTPRISFEEEKPNPNLYRLIREYEKKSKNLESNIDMLNRPIMGKKGSALYQSHTFWSKKPFDAVAEYIRHYTEPGGLVLDPFCGCGGTLIAAMFEGRNGVGIDLAPTATFVTNRYISPVNLKKAEKMSKELVNKVKIIAEPLYKVKLNKKSVIVSSYVWSERYRCIKCYPN
jgi:DNA modification methylase